MHGIFPPSQTGDMAHVRAADYSVIPLATFTGPEVARVGVSEDEAKKRGIACRTSPDDYQISIISMGFNANARAQPCPLYGPVPTGPAMEMRPARRMTRLMLATGCRIDW